MQGPRLSADEAVRAAWTGLGQAADTAASAQASHVRRLDGEGDTGYYLVLLPDPASGYTVVAVDDASGDVQSWASIASPPLSVDSAQARETAALGENADVELVWAPTRLSMSLLAPFWAVSRGRQRVFVDQANHRWETAAPMGPGGAPRT